MIKLPMLSVNFAVHVITNRSKGNPATSVAAYEFICAELGQIERHAKPTQKELSTVRLLRDKVFLFGDFVPTSDGEAICSVFPRFALHREIPACTEACNILMRIRAEHGIE